MKIVLGLCSIICTFWLFSSSEPRDYEQLKGMLTKALSINISGNFEIIEYESSAAIGDYLENYKFKFERDDFNKLMEVVLKSDKWELNYFGNYQKLGILDTNEFNQYIVTVYPKNNEVHMQFIWE